MHADNKPLEDDDRLALAAEITAAVGTRPSSVSQHVSQLVADALRHSEHPGSGVPPHHR